METVIFNLLDTSNLFLSSVFFARANAFLRLSAKAGEKERKAFFLRTGNRTDELDAEQFYKYTQNRL